MLLTRGPFVLLLAVFAWSLPAQSGAVPASPAAASAGAGVSGSLRPSLSQVAQALANLNIRRWKAPNSVRDAAEEDVSSIQRDLSGTLAGLLEQADASPGSVPSAFAVYRNVDALYDTLLRVVETAELAAPDDESTALQSALSNLESARANLGDIIQGSSQAQQTELIRLRTVIAATTAQRAPVRTTVVNDYPSHEAEVHHHHVTKKASSTAQHKPASSTQQQPAGSTTQQKPPSQ